MEVDHPYALNRSMPTGAISLHQIRLAPGRRRNRYLYDPELFPIISSLTVEITTPAKSMAHSRML